MHFWKKVRTAALIACALASPQPVSAAGGAHGVDDAAVETPGDCHLESWFSDFGRGETLLNLSPACTAKSLPMLEIGGAIQRVGAPGDRHWLAGPALKWTIRDGGSAPGERAGIALAGSALVDFRSGRVDSAALLVPVTLAPVRDVAINLNVGAGYSRGEGGHALYGAQIDYVVTDKIALMAEVFGRPDAAAGWQGGLRRTGDRGRVDIDLLAGRQPGSGNDIAVTLGFTIRR
ncbi:MAG: hypothetical protein CVT78_09680 [Alphaproteobacteria bacterium HGW-Alphaproteobacteria-17]|nr:MAG: hypothetical protein CVT78_09680 [Alphaproteobacteria bacterium HGW-Alphaproteobacteria-17]